MPERRTVRKVPTPDVQGADSWVLLRSMTVGEVLLLKREAEKAPSLGARLRKLLRIKEKAQTDSEVYERFMRRVLSFVADWNWVDEHGEPLPNPREKPNVVLRLTDAEMLALTNIVYGRGEQQETKN